MGFAVVMVILDSHLPMNILDLELVQHVKRDVPVLVLYRWALVLTEA